MTPPVEDGVEPPAGELGPMPQCSSCTCEKYISALADRLLAAEAELREVRASLPAEDAAQALDAHGARAARKGGRARNEPAGAKSDSWRRSPKESTTLFTGRHEGGGAASSYASSAEPPGLGIFEPSGDVTRNANAHGEQPMFLAATAEERLVLAQTLALDPKALDPNCYIGSDGDYFTGTHQQGGDDGSEDAFYQGFAETGSPYVAEQQPRVVSLDQSLFGAEGVPRAGAPKGQMPAPPQAQMPPNLLSVGSAEHPSNCRPCVWHWRTRMGGCVNGQSCTFCHACSFEQVKQRRRDMKKLLGRDSFNRRMRKGPAKKEAGLADLSASGGPFILQ